MFNSELSLNHCRNHAYSTKNIFQRMSRNALSDGAAAPPGTLLYIWYVSPIARLAILVFDLNAWNNPAME
jgi:hypothetical protein